MASRGPTSENSDMESANKPASSWPLKQGPKKWSKHGCDNGTLTVATGLGTYKEKKVWVDIHVQAAGSQICLHNMCGQQRNSPMADPIFGSKYGPQNGVQNWITFSFLLLGLCLGPVLGSRFGPKSGVSHRRILLLPAEVLQADLRRTSMSVSVNTCFFSLCVPLCFLYILRLQAGHDTMFCWLAFCDRICLPFNLRPVMNLVSDGCWLVTYLALCDRPSHCHGAAPRKRGGTIAS